MIGECTLQEYIVVKQKNELERVAIRNYRAETGYARRRGQKDRGHEPRSVF